MLDLQGMTVDRIVVHDIHPRASDKSLVPPTYGEQLVSLPPSGMAMFTARIVQALGHHSHGIQAQFSQLGSDSFFAAAVELMEANDEGFLATSRAVADSLARAQVARSLAPSKLLVVSGHCASPPRPYCAVVKAELQDALAEKLERGRSVIDYLNKIFFAESQKLYKIGFVQQVNSLAGVQHPESYAVHLFDHLMTGTETRSAAFYFYKDFLGADVSASDRHLTRQFFEKTNDFLNTLKLSPSRRIELGESLRAELRSNEQTIGVRAFGKKHFEADTQPKYEAFMKRANFPTSAITKDVDYIKARLKRRQKITFTSGVMITTPPDQVKELVSIQTRTVDGNTLVTIRGTVESEE